MTENEVLVKDEKEAIEVIKSNIPTSGYYMLREACEMAIKALEEVQEYRKIGTVEECRTAVEKQKPKKIKIKPWSPARCPSCDYELSYRVGDGYYKHPTFLERCPECGQKIDWGDENE